MTDTPPAPADAGPPLPGTAYARSQLSFLLRASDVPHATMEPPDFSGCPLRGQIACLRNLLIIERAMFEASQKQDRPRWDELVRAHEREMAWLRSFEVHQKVRGA